jgi:hypothetical protein
MRIVVNPGSGPVEGATEEHAWINIQHFIADCGDGWRAELRQGLNMVDGGRYSFLVWRGNRCHLVDMPGLPLDQVRYAGSEGQRAGDYPRLYVDGGSWLWKFALRRFGADEELEL